MHLSRFFVQTASRQARRALRLYREPDSAALVHAGLAVELLCKAYVSRASPALLVDLSNKADMTASVIALTELDAGRRSTSERLPLTLTAGATVERVKTLDPKHGLNSEDIPKLLDARNAYLHWGIDGETERLTDLLPRFARAANRLLFLLDEGEAAWWDEEADFAAGLAARGAAATNHEAAAVLQRAADTLARYRVDYGDAEDELQALFAVKSARGIESLVENERQIYPFTCSVCDNQGAFQGYWDVQWDWSYEYVDGEYYASNMTADSGVFTADSFECFACGLKLRTVDHLEYAEMALRDALDTDIQGDYDLNDLIGDADPADAFDQH